MPTAAVEHLSPLDPISYIRRVGLRPEDTYGFIPTKLEEGAEMLYLYRDHPEYEQARSVPDTGPRVPMMAPEDPGGPFADLIQQAQELQRAYGGGQVPAFGAPGDPLPAMPDPQKLVEAAKLRASGAIDDAEYARLRAEAGAPDPGSGAQSQPAAPAGEGPEIVAHRIYPGLRSRSSVDQLDEFLPAYGQTVGLRPEDVYGVFPWGARSRTGADTTEDQWDDYWVVYRDRPEYADGREAYARAMDDSGRWPSPVTAPGVGEPTGAAGPAGEVQVADELGPRSMLIIKQTGGQLADWLKQKIGERGYEPEDSYGFCPSFTQRSIYFGWRRR